jgi:hypothetical protein
MSKNPLLDGLEDDERSNGDQSEIKVRSDRDQNESNERTQTDLNSEPQPKNPRPVRKASKKRDQTESKPRTQTDLSRDQTESRDGSQPDLKEIKSSPEGDLNMIPLLEGKIATLSSLVTDLQHKFADHLGHTTPSEITRDLVWAEIKHRGGAIHNWLTRNHKGNCERPGDLDFLVNIINHFLRGAGP